MGATERSVSSADTLREPDRDDGTLRKPEYLPPEEVKVAITRVVAENFGAEQDQLIQVVARLFGFGATSVQLREVVENALADLLESGQLRLDGRLISRAQSEGALPSIS